MSHWLALAGPPKWLLLKDWLLLIEEERKGPPMLEPGVAGGVAAGVAKGVAVHAAGEISQDLRHLANFVSHKRKCLSLTCRRHRSVAALQAMPAKGKSRGFVRRDDLQVWWPRSRWAGTPWRWG